MARRLKIKLNRKWRNVLAGSLAVLLLAGAVFGIVSLATGRDSRTVGAGDFSIGGLDKDGQFVRTESTLVSDYIECQGLTVEATDQATGTYQVFYYDADKILLGSTESLAVRSGIYRKEDSFVLAKYARIILAPTLEVDEDESDKEAKIRFWQVSGFVDDFIITVDREQEAAKELALRVVEDDAPYAYTLTLGEGVDACAMPADETYSHFDLTELVNVKGYDLLISDASVRYVHFWNAEKKLCQSDHSFVFNANMNANSLEIPEDAVYVSFTVIGGDDTSVEAYAVRLDR